MRRAMNASAMATTNRPKTSWMGSENISRRPMPRQQCSFWASWSAGAWVARLRPLAVRRLLLPRAPRPRRVWGSPIYAALVARVRSARTRSSSGFGASTTSARVSDVVGGLSETSAVGGATAATSPCLRGSCRQSRRRAPARASLSPLVEARHVERLQGIRRDEPEDLGEELDLRVERTADSLGAAEAVTFAWERDVRARDAPCGQGRDQRLRLGRRDDPVVEALHHEHRARDPVEEVDRRAFAVDIGHLRIRADEPVHVARFELVGVAREHLEVADPVSADAGREDVAEGEGCQRRVAAGTPTHDRQPLSVDVAALDEELGRRDDVVDIDDPPLRVELATVGPAIPAAAPVVDVDDGDAATGQPLRRRDRAPTRRCRSGRRGS